MKRNLFLVVFSIFCLIIFWGSTSCQRKIYPAVMFECETNDVSEFITIRFDGQFFYNRPEINRSLCGKREFENDTISFLPYIMYYFENDSIVADEVQGMSMRDIPNPYWATKLLYKKNHLIDITNYHEIFPDSVLPPTLMRREFKRVK